jgi:hypothetical protein
MKRIYRNPYARRFDDDEAFEHVSYTQQERKTYDMEPTRVACPACPDGNEWDSNGPTGRACQTCDGKAYLEGAQ